MRCAGLYIWLLLLPACAESGSGAAIEDDPMFAGIWGQEEAIEDCMRQRGFEYIAFFDAAEDPAAVEAHPELAERPPLENPNDSIVAALSPAERSGYDAALWGSSAFDPAGGGCTAVAFKEAYGISAVQLFPDRDRIDRFKSAIASDPRVVKAEEGWRVCMSEAGFVTSLTRQDYFDWLNLSLDVFSDAARSQETDLEDIAGYSEFQATYDAAYVTHERCRVDYELILNKVQTELGKTLFEN